MKNVLTGKSINKECILQINKLPLPRDIYYKDPYGHKLFGYALATWFAKIESGSVEGAVWVPIDF